MFPPWAITLGGISAALSVAGIRQGQTHFIASISAIYHMDKAGEESGCVPREDGCAYFLLLTPLPALWESWPFSRCCSAYREGTLQQPTIWAGAGGI